MPSNAEMRDVLLASSLPEHIQATLMARYGLPNILRALPLAENNTNGELQAIIAEMEKELFYKHLVETKRYLQAEIKKRTGGRDTLDGWIVCGSGLASLPRAEGITILGERRNPDKKGILAKEIPHWPLPKAPGHGTEIFIADIGGQLVGIATGRAHIYDTNYTPMQLRMITSPLVIAKGLGIQWLVTTNAAGILDNGRVKVGDVVVDVDYVNQQGVNPFIGLDDERLGSRFPGKANVADPDLFVRLEKRVPP